MLRAGRSVSITLGKCYTILGNIIATDYTD